MAVVQSYETFAARRVFSFRLVDQFAAAARTQGPYPSVIGRIRMLVMERTDIGRVYDPQRELEIWRNATGYYLTGGDVLPAAASAPPLVLGAGTYKIRIESEYYLPAEFAVNWPLEATSEVPLFPTPAYPFPDLTANPIGMGLTMTRGCVFAPDGKPKAGADVSVEIQELDWTIPADWPLAQAKSNSNGEWVLVLPEQREMIDPVPAPPLQSMQVRYNLDGNAFEEQAWTGRENRYMQAALRGSAVDKDGRPLAGVTIENSLQAGAAATDAGGRWSIYFPFNQTDAVCNVKATNPNGQVLNRNKNVLAHKTVIVDRFQFL